MFYFNIYNSVLFLEVCISNIYDTIFICYISDVLKCCNLNCVNDCRHTKHFCYKLLHYILYII